MHTIEIMVHFKKAIIAAIISGAAGITDLILEPEYYIILDYWLGILIKIIGGAAGIYSIIEVRKKSKSYDKKQNDLDQKNQLYPGRTGDISEGDKIVQDKTEKSKKNL